MNANTRIPIAASSSWLYTAISSRFPAQQITCTGQLLHMAKKKIQDNPHLKSKENLHQKAPEFTNLEANLYWGAFLKCKLLCVIKPYTVIFSCRFLLNWRSKQIVYSCRNFLVLVPSCQKCICHLSMFHIQQNANLWPTFVVVSDRSTPC